MKVAITRPLRHEFFQTAGRAVADAIASQLPPAEITSLSDALHSVAFCCDGMLSDPNRASACSFAKDTALGDRALPGETFVIFSDGNPKRGFAGAQIWISDILSARNTLDQVGLTNARANALVRHLWRTKAGGSIQHYATDLCKLAAHILDDRDIGRLRSLTGTLPIVCIIGDTRATGPTSGKFFRAVVPLPGSWLGTLPSAGTA